MGVVRKVLSRIGVGRLNPRGPNKFEPTTRAEPRPDGPDHGAPGEQTNAQKHR